MSDGGTRMPAAGAGPAGADPDAVEAGADQAAAETPAADSGAAAPGSIAERTDEAAASPASASSSRPDAPSPASAPIVEPVSPDVTVAGDAAFLPGVHRGGYLRLPTAPIQVTTQSAPSEPGVEEPHELLWEPAPEPVLPHRGLAGWALLFAIIGLVVSFFVGWGFPIGVVAIVSALLALRRPLESRAMAVWALSLGVVSVLYSAGWLAFAAMRAELFV
ncbi:hypothetical protein [Microbacterium terrae]|uniref:hypothetical protein n=1 Tax=Microbacterium terrae TaxID=69369 RepID=UPI0022F24F96|nr:hypothetical protein [Microbacterium terrae]